MNTIFRTTVNIPKSAFDINYNSPAIFVGSCFSENIGNKFLDKKFPAIVNPFGVIYNPASLGHILTLCANSNNLPEESLIKHNNLWHSFLFHSSFSEKDKDSFTGKAQEMMDTFHNFLKKANYLIVTFGTSWVYYYNEKHQVVANCHKIPQKEFTRERLSVSQITNDWKAVINLLQGINPTLKIIFTVSPVRHLKDGANGNQLSKSTLLLAIEKLVKSTINTEYFPAYEIVNDELRDYRFYQNDMTHISELAVDYIFEKFITTYFSSSTISIMNEVEKIRKGMRHKILTDNTEGIHKFSESMLNQISKLEQKNPGIDFSIEKNHFIQLMEK